MDNNTEIQATGSFLTGEVFIRGSVESKRNMTLKGKIVGNVRCDNRLTIDDGAIIEGDVVCKDLELRGFIMGNANVSSETRLHQSAVIKGSLLTSQLVIHPEAKVEKGLNIK